MKNQKRVLMTGKKKEETLPEKPDFRAGDRIAGKLQTHIYAKEFPTKVARMRGVDHISSYDPYYANRYPEPVWMGDPEYEDGWVTKVERKGNEEFFTVSVAPYTVDKKWCMLVVDSKGIESEVDCKVFHLVGERVEPVAPKPLISKKTKEKIVKLGKPAIITAVVLGLLAIIGFWLAGNYNSLVQANNAVDNSKAKIDTQLERRYELIDNIVASVKGSQAQESDVFGKIAEARKIGSSATSEGQKADANAAIDTQIALLPRLQEAYPELRSNDQVTRLIQELQGTAGQVASARDNYNNTVTNYNTNITSFPKNIFAGMFNFQKKDLFKASKAAETNPKVDLNRE
jgi:LemA protein